MKTQSHASDHHLLFNTLTRTVLAAIIAASPELLLAAKVTTTPFISHKPIPHKVTNTQAPASIKKVIPSKNLGQNPQPQVKLPTIRSKPVNKPSPNRSTTLGNVTRPLPANTIGSKAAAIQGAEQARQLGATKGALEGLRDITGALKPSNGIEPNTGLGASLFPGKGDRHVFDPTKLPGGLNAESGFPDPMNRLPILPSNQDQSKLGSAPTTPSSDFRTIMGGAAGWPSDNDEDTRVYHSVGITGGLITRYVRGNTTIVIIQHRQIDRATGRAVDIGLTTRIKLTRNQDGTPGVSEIRQTDAEGNVVYEEGRPPKNDFNKTQDPNDYQASGSWARWMAKWAGQRPDLDLKTNLNQVNPGPDAATPNPQAPQLGVPTQNLVINPDPEAFQGQDTTLDARTEKLLRQQLQDMVKGPGYDPARP